MKLIVGLGNPGEKYQHNRHNVGFMTVEALVRKLDVGDWRLEKKFEAEIVKTKETIFAKPQTFMNDSGRAVRAIANFYKIDFKDIYIIHDDLDIPLGGSKVQFGKGPRIHNGLLSIEKELGTDQFWNVRIGVENREVKGNKGIPGVEYSLQNFTQNENLTVDTVINGVVERLIDTG
jgi:PTH1 family peptidyl-tRNA hydrolase